MTESKVPLRIAFGCQHRVGKDTAADYLISRYGGIRVSFADPLYDILHYAQDRIGLPRQKDRQFLKWVGTEWARSHDPEIWLKLALKTIQESPEQNIFISDVRFPNEFDALEAAGFHMVRIRRPGVESANTDPHPSERALLTPKYQQRWKISVNNDSDLDTYYAKLERVVEYIRSG